MEKGEPRRKQPCFNPTDADLVAYYLPQRTGAPGEDYECRNLVPTVDLYEFDPPELIKHGVHDQGKNMWYFFTQRERKYANGSRPRRCTPGGRWKSINTKQDVRDANGSLMGTKMALDFVWTRPDSTAGAYRWKMHEFLLPENIGYNNEAEEGDQRNKERTKSPMLEGYALCRVYKSKRTSRSRAGGEGEEGRATKKRAKRNHQMQIIPHPHDNNGFISPADQVAPLPQLAPPISADLQTSAVPDGPFHPLSPLPNGSFAGSHTALRHAHPYSTSTQTMNSICRFTTTDPVAPHQLESIGFRGGPDGYNGPAADMQRSWGGNITQPDWSEPQHDGHQQYPMQMQLAYDVFPLPPSPTTNDRLSGGAITDMQQLIRSTTPSALQIDTGAQLKPHQDQRDEFISPAQLLAPLVPLEQLAQTPVLSGDQLPNGFDPSAPSRVHPQEQDPARVHPGLLNRNDSGFSATCGSPPPLLWEPYNDFFTRSDWSELPKLDRDGGLMKMVYSDDSPFLPSTGERQPSDRLFLPPDHLIDQVFDMVENFKGIELWDAVKRFLDG